MTTVIRKGMRISFPDLGTTWPDPFADGAGELAYEVHHGEKPSQQARLFLSACHEAYVSLLAPETTAECAVRNLRDLRRAIKSVRPR